MVVNPHLTSPLPHSPAPRGHVPFWVVTSPTKLFCETKFFKVAAILIPEVHRLAAAEYLNAEEEEDSLWLKKACNFWTNVSVHQLEDCVVPLKRSQSRLDISYATMPQDLLALLLGREGMGPIDAPGAPLEFQSDHRAEHHHPHLHLTDDAVLQHLHLTTLLPSRERHATLLVSVGHRQLQPLLCVEGYRCARVPRPAVCLD